MIRNVVVGVLTPEATIEQAQAALAAIHALDIPGIEYRVQTGLDLGLREGNASFAITADFVSAEDYRIYDADDEHNRVRRELFAPICSSIQRIQFELNG